MPVEFHVSIFDEDRARREGKWGEIRFSFSGMTEPQRDLLITILNRTVRGLEEHRPREEVNHVTTQDRLWPDPA